MGGFPTPASNVVWGVAGGCRQTGEPAIPGTEWCRMPGGPRLCPPTTPTPTAWRNGGPWPIARQAAAPKAGVAAHWFGQAMLLRLPALMRTMSPTPVTNQECAPSREFLSAIDNVRRAVSASRHCSRYAVRRVAQGDLTTTGLPQNGALRRRDRASAPCARTGRGTPRHHAAGPHAAGTGAGLGTTRQ